MEEQSKKITNYLRKAILAQVDKGIEFKNDEFYPISKENLLKGDIDPKITEKLFENNKQETQKHHESAKNKEIENEKQLGNKNIYML